MRINIGYICDKLALSVGNDHLHRNKYDKIVTRYRIFRQTHTFVVGNTGSRGGICFFNDISILFKENHIYVMRI